eukprot:2563479-Amphidinium_carterae.2
MNSSSCCKTSNATSSKQLPLSLARAAPSCKPSPTPLVVVRLAQMTQTRPTTHHAPSNLKSATTFRAAFSDSKHLETDLDAIGKLPEACLNIAQVLNALVLRAKHLLSSC